MSDSHNTIGILLTFSDVQRKVEEYRELERSLKDILGRMGEAANWINAVHDLIPADKRPDFLVKVTVPGVPEISIVGKAKTPTEPLNIEDYGGVSRLYVQILSKAPEGLTYDQFREAIKGTELEERIISSPNTLYTNVTRLVTKKKLCRAGSRIFTPENYAAALRKYGKDWDGFKDEVATGLASSIQTIVVDALLAHPQGLEVGRLIEAMRRDPTVRQRLDQNKQYPYSVLSKMLDRKLVYKAGSRYFRTKEAAQVYEAGLKKEAGGELSFDRPN